MKHTPGPWEARTCYTKGEPVEYAIESKHPEHSGMIATVHITVDNDEQDYANARLIAAAPELEEACNEVLQAWHDDDSNFEKAEPRYLILARAAILKVEGR